MADISELALEQKHFDEAWTARQAMRENLGNARQAAANKGAAARIGKAAAAFMGKLGGPNDPVAHGRFDHEGETFYVGMHGIFDANRDVMVLDWRTKHGELYEQATVADPRGVTVKRAFKTDRNTIEDFEDFVFADLAERLSDLTEFEQAGVNDVLLDDLNQKRTGAMRDIVKTIQASQSGLIRHPLESLLVIQGGPGTGKSAVALHRASWIIFNHPDVLKAEDILIVGPTDTFTNYIKQVLPALGENDVVQRSLRRLGPQPSNRRDEPLETAALKGHAKMAELLRRALHLRVRFSGDDAELLVGRGRGSTAIPRERVEAQLEALRSSSSYSQGRTAMRASLVRSVEEAQLAKNPRASVSVDATAVDNALERVWPQLTALSFLQDLLGSTARITEAAGDDFTAGDINRLYRQSAARLAAETWSDSDVALLDEADHLIRGTVDQFTHIIVDEAQDLTPMQLRSLRRRSRTGSYTIVGDIAQSTGPSARGSWDDIIETLRMDHPSTSEELGFCYRVPEGIFEVAARLLPRIAPGLTAPTVVRPAPEPPSFVLTDPDTLCDGVVAAVEGHAGKGRFVGVVVAPSQHRAAAEALKAAGVNFADADSGQLGASVNLVSAAEAKGLEFDAVVVVEPAAIAEIDDSGLRLLYIGLTRATKYLTVVHGREFAPLDLAGLPNEPVDAHHVDVEPVPAVPEPTPPAPATIGPVSEATGGAAASPDTLSPLLKGAASSLADQIRSGVSSEQWATILDEVRSQLGLDAEA